MLSRHHHLKFPLIFIALGMLLWVPARATVVIPPEFEKLAAKSDYIVRGRVTALHSEIQIKGNSRRIYTSVEVEVLETIAGNPPAKLVLECLGGRVADEEMIVEGAPVFKVGAESVLFISGNGRALCPLYAMNYGYYPVQVEAASKRRYVARGNEVRWKMSPKSHSLCWKVKPPWCNGGPNPPPWRCRRRSSRKKSKR